MSKPESQKPDALEHIKSKSETTVAEAIYQYSVVLQDVSNDIGKLLRALQNREEDRLSKIIPDDDIPRIFRATKRLLEITPTESKDFEEMYSLFTALTESISSIGSIRTQGIVDDVENLRRLSSSLGNITEKTRQMADNLKLVNSPEAISVSLRADKLADAAYDRKMYMFRRVQLLSDEYR